MLSNLHNVFVKIPLAALLMLAMVLFALFCFIAAGVTIFFIRRKIRYGIWVEEFGEDRLFVPCNTNARRILVKYCKGKDFKKFPFGSYVVPNARYWEVYEGVMHDPEKPQCITQYSKLLKCHLTDTP